MRPGGESIPPLEFRGNLPFGSQACMYYSFCFYILCYFIVLLANLGLLELNGVEQLARLSFDRAFAFVCAIMWRDFMLRAFCLLHVWYRMTCQIAR